ncbi:unnamed protein product [Penicillium salamii]|uniref:D-aminopeptidase n=1 Tax=Penicillium salamii TaxID=1612424 RepID=A0A9W4J5X3_9EURO|nr:unnamed protein product [Penicillium salamii]CAG8390240.1 unnamed protein product [Penicillium salamii]CAG8408744.1 unnamed protein product [Penicillium salamii]CAG8412356.1 unnamed protein product [Penicillium salamii]
MPDTKEHTQSILDSIARRCKSPGGAIAVLKDGQLLAQRVWGFADLSQRIPLTPHTQFPICSITKQFICALILDLERTIPSIRSQLSDVLPDILPGVSVTIDQLCHMQSGLRDYWALTTLLGAKPDDEFLIERDSPGLRARTKSVHFAPGTEFSYCNLNFHVLGLALERVTGRPLGELLQERILSPAGMETAFLCPNTAEHPAPCVGYEGDEQRGFVPAVNRMEWAGDAGLVASLNDMIAYEKYLDACYVDEGSWYRGAIAKPVFGDGTAAPYAFGLSHVDIGGVKTVGHGGALRGYRLERRHAPSERLSVVVLLNGQGDSSGPGAEIFREVLDIPKPVLSAIKPVEEWFGAFLDRDTQLAIVVTKGARDGEVAISYAGGPEKVALSAPTQAKNNSMVAAINGDTLGVHRIRDNRRLSARRIVPDEAILKNTPFQGVYHCEEIDSTFHCIGEAGTFYGAFDGYLGQGHATPLKYLGGDVWALTCPRGLDAPAPGDWTVVFHRDENNAVKGFTIGCWLARGLEYIKKI